MLVDEGSITVAGNAIQLPISGKGYLRVLYNDENLRIFSSPRDSPDRWEEAGLIVVQVDARRVLGDSWRPAYLGS